MWESSENTLLERPELFGDSGIQRSPAVFEASGWPGPGTRAPVLKGPWDPMELTLNRSLSGDAGLLKI